MVQGRAGLQQGMCLEGAEGPSLVRWQVTEERAGGKK